LVVSNAIGYFKCQGWGFSTLSRGFFRASGVFAVKAIHLLYANRLSFSHLCLRPSMCSSIPRNVFQRGRFRVAEARAPAGHEVVLLDGNAKSMDDSELVQFVRGQKIDLVGIGAMTRMIARAYRALLRVSHQSRNSEHPLFGTLAFIAKYR
jgi:hypothetical protein